MGFFSPTGLVLAVIAIVYVVCRCIGPDRGRDIKLQLYSAICWRAWEVSLSGTEVMDGLGVRTG